MRRSRRNGQWRRTVSWWRAVAGHDQGLLVGARGLGQDDAERIGDEAAAPELDALARCALGFSWPTRLTAAT